jgi:hypothetical protein
MGRLSNSTPTVGRAAAFTERRTTGRPRRTASAAPSGVLITRRRSPSATGSPPRASSGVNLFSFSPSPALLPTDPFRRHERKPYEWHRSAGRATFLHPSQSTSRFVVTGPAHGRQDTRLYPPHRFEMTPRPCHPRRPKGGALDPEGRLPDSTRRGDFLTRPGGATSWLDPEGRLPGSMRWPPSAAIDLTISTHLYCTVHITVPAERPNLLPAMLAASTPYGRRSAARPTGAPGTETDWASVPPPSPAILGHLKPSTLPIRRPNLKHVSSNLTSPAPGRRPRTPTPQPRRSRRSVPVIRTHLDLPAKTSHAIDPFRRDGKATPATTRSDRTTPPRRSDRTNPQPVPPKRPTRRSANTTASDPGKPRQRATSRWPRAHSPLLHSVVPPSRRR